MNLFFDQVYVIHLKRREDRYKSFRQEFYRAGIDYEIVDAVDGKTLDNIPPEKQGSIGCTMSHLKALKLAKKRNLRNVLICEDDVVFVEEVQLQFNKTIFQLPVYYDMLYLGHNPTISRTTQPTPYYSENFNKAMSVLATHCYGVNGKMIDDLIEKVETDITRGFDVHCWDLQPIYQCFCCYPMLAFQKEGYSDIENKIVDYSGCIKDDRKF